MKSRLRAGVLSVAWLLFATSAGATEPYLDFVKGLRDQGYYDYALIYLDQINVKSNTPAEIKVLIPYEKAMTLLQGSKTERSPEKQLAQLDQALGFLEEFVKDNPNHPAAADANYDRATILLDKGKAEARQAKQPGNTANKRAVQDRARELISKSRQVFQTATDQLEANLKKYPTFIDKAKDPEQAAAKAKVETNLIESSLKLGMCTYEEAQTYDPSSNEFKTLLDKAADEFEKLHQKHRSVVGGLYARAWQGKCYEEQKKYSQALGIYGELLANPGEDAALSALKTQALYFKLICLNTKEKHDYQVVVDLADEWIKKHQNESKTFLGIGIQWEQALAYESLASNPDIITQEKERFWRQARNVAMQIQKSPTEYRDVAAAMVQRMSAKLGQKDTEARDFATASGLANSAFKNSQDIKRDLDEAIKIKKPKEEIDKLQLDFLNELNEAARNYERGFSLIKKEDSKKDILTARLYYSYVNFYLHRNYEAAILAEYVAKTADKDDGSLGLDGAYLAMAAFIQAYAENKAPVDQKGEDMQLIIKSCNVLADRWPSSDKANEAYMQLGRIYDRQKKPANAATWFGKVPSTDPKYPEAQINAGQAYWTAYLTSARMTGSDKPTPDQLAGWLKSAQDHLRNGINVLAPKVAKEGTPPTELIVGKMSLAQILISQGKDADALKLLLDEPQSVIKAVTVPDEKRAETGITSRRFATESYKLLLRAYIGMGNLEKARETMKTLETIAGGEGVGSDVTELYVSLGKQLKEELERLRASGENERFDNLMKSFETFLNDMASRKEGQTFGSLSWIGETYFALGETIDSDPGKSSAFYEKAGNAFTEILNRAKEDAAFASPLQLYSVKLRQVRVHRLKKEFEPAETLMSEVLKENVNNLTAQVGAAELYQEWGLSGQDNSSKKLAIAISGNDKNGAWGWGKIAGKLQKSSEFGTNPVYLQNFLDARYNGTLCHHRYARDLGPKERQKELENCRRELIATCSVVKEISDEQYEKYNKLYSEILQDLGAKQEKLPRFQDVPLAPPVKKVEPEKTPEAEAKKPAAPAAPPKAPEGGGTMMWLGFGLCVVLGLGWIGWVVMNSKGKPKSKSFGSMPSAESVALSGFSEPDEPIPGPLVTVSAPKPKPRPAAAPAGATKPSAKPAATKPATKPAAKPSAPGAAASGAPAPKPKPKPPAPPAG